MSWNVLTVKEVELFVTQSLRGPLLQNILSIHHPLVYPNLNLLIVPNFLVFPFSVTFGEGTERGYLVTQYYRDVRWV